MDKKELEEGMKKAEESAEKMDGEQDGGGDEKWAPSLDWIMDSVGPFFNNNKGLGELLLGKLNESGIDTQSVALAGLVNVLQQFSREYKALGEAMGDNLDKINDLSSQSEDLSKAVKDLIEEMGGSTDDAPDIHMDGMGGMGDGGMPPPDMGDGGMPPPDMGGGGMPSPDMGGGGMPPPDMGGGGMPSPDMGGGGMPPPDMGGGGMPPPDMGGGGMPPPDMGGLGISDERVKNVRKGVLSDENLKRRTGMSYDELVGVISDIGLKRFQRMRGSSGEKGDGTRISPSIIDACSSIIGG